MRLRRPQLIGLFVFLFIPVTWLVWQTQDQSEINPSTAVPLIPSPTLMEGVATLSATAVPTTVATSIPTNTSTVTLFPTETATTTPTATATKAPTQTPTIMPIPRINRACPDPIPLKPAYNRYYLSARPWPASDTAVAEPPLLVGETAARRRPFFSPINGFLMGMTPTAVYLLHTGVDSAEPLGTPVLAVADGTVIVARPDMNEWYGWRCDWYGHLVVIELDQQWLGQPVYALYGHVINISVEESQRVSQGDPVAEVGFGGAALSRLICILRCGWAVMNLVPLEIRCCGFTQARRAA